MLAVKLISPGTWLFFYNILSANFQSNQQGTYITDKTIVVVIFLFKQKTSKVF
jgi:hypothetical protein